MRVAVIGTGAGGLVVVRHLVAQPEVYTKVVAFEQCAVVGGTWVYTDQVGQDDRGLPIHSSMYRNLKTNLPKEVMAFPDFPFSKKLPSFIRHQDVRQYLEDYTEEFGIRKYIQFNTQVVTVKPTDAGAPDTKWQLHTRNTEQSSGQCIPHEFDAVIICNGHYTEPLIPDIPGLDKFKGKVMHSHDYRTPSAFRGMRVLCLGAAASGCDIALDIAEDAKEVLLSHWKPRLMTPLPPNVRQSAALKSLRGNIAVLQDGEECEIDAVLFCTGYCFKFPFLAAECGISVESERVTPLYKHIVNTQYPTMSFIGICKTVCPFPQFDCQARFILAYLDGSMKLPSKEEMDRDTEDDYKWRLGQGMPHRYAHTMGNLQWAYNDMLAKLAGFPPIPRGVQTLYDAVHATRVQNLPGYKTLNYEIIGENSYRISNVGCTEERFL